MMMSTVRDRPPSNLRPPRHPVRIQSTWTQCPSTACPCADTGGCLRAGCRVLIRLDHPSTVTPLPTFGHGLIQFIADNSTLLTTVASSRNVSSDCIGPAGWQRAGRNRRQPMGVTRMIAVTRPDILLRNLKDGQVGRGHVLAGGGGNNLKRLTATSSAEATGGKPRQCVHPHGGHGQASAHHIFRLGSRRR